MCTYLHIYHDIMSTKTRTYLFIGWMNSTTPFQSNVSAMSLSTATLPSHNLARILIDSRIGQYAAVLSGDFKGWQGRLVRLTDATATIECPGRQQQPEITRPLKDFVLL